MIENTKALDDRKFRERSIGEASGIGRGIRWKN